MTGLVSGIVNDAQELIKQQLALFRRELEDGVRRAKLAVVFLAVGAGIFGLGGILLCFTLVHLLSWAARELPLWACYCIVGTPIALFGAGLLFAGIRQFRSSLMPEQSAEALKENLQWLRNPK